MRFTVVTAGQPIPAEVISLSEPASLYLARALAVTGHAPGAVLTEWEARDARGQLIDLHRSMLELVSEYEERAETTVDADRIYLNPKPGVAA